MLGYYNCEPMFIQLDFFIQRLPYRLPRWHISFQISQILTKHVAIFVLAFKHLRRSTNCFPMLIHIIDSVCSIPHTMLLQFDTSKCMLALNLLYLFSIYSLLKTSQIQYLFCKRDFLFSFHFKILVSVIYRKAWRSEYMSTKTWGPGAYSRKTLTYT